LSRLQIQGDVYEFKKKETSREQLKEQIENVGVPFREMNLKKEVKFEIV